MSETRYHSVVLDEESCKGCTVCVTTCPTKAIRVRGGKARIIAERCIDCGECIRRCPNHAKKALTDRFPDELAASPGENEESENRISIALPAPALYAQFPHYGVEEVHRALLSLGFDAVFPVARVTGDIARASASFLDRKRYPRLPRPLISSSCPTIIKLIQIRFPTLIEHIVPVIAPMELAARRARDSASASEPEDEPRNIDVFFISPCAGKITEAKAPLGKEASAVTGVFGMKDLFIPILSVLKKNAEARAAETTIADDDRSSDDSYLQPAEIAWGRAGGEAEATMPHRGTASIAVDGMDQCVKILEAIEDGKLEGIEFLELMACTYGCVGGPLSVTNPALARHALEAQEGALTPKSRAAPKREPDERPIDDCLRASPYPERPTAFLLDPDYKTAMAMLERMESIAESLPGLDCGCCGAPGCHALAEDIVRGIAVESDCVIILKDQYRKLLDGESPNDPMEASR